MLKKILYYSNDKKISIFDKGKTSFICSVYKNRLRTPFFFLFEASFFRHLQSSFNYILMLYID